MLGRSADDIAAIDLAPDPTALKPKDEGGADAVRFPD